MAARSLRQAQIRPAPHVWFILSSERLGHSLRCVQAPGTPSLQMTPSPGVRLRGELRMMASVVLCYTQTHHRQALRLRRINPLKGFRCCLGACLSE
mmetsp:Transcript_27281/g.58767  ORF Transcript_27281/g.58767 Transcript_27281/m.58767 type:complete len:96 (+) Transcript_27281:380-667(+)